MNEKIKITEPSLEINELQEKVITELSQILPTSQVELIGSMAVPISGRLEIDVMVMTSDVSNDSKLLSENGYRQGPVIDRVSYLSIKRDRIRIDLQVLPFDHKMVGIHRNTLKKLRKNPELRERYEEFKKSLDGLSKDEYKKKKVEWIENNLLQLQDEE